MFADCKYRSECERDMWCMSTDDFVRTRILLCCCCNVVPDFSACVLNVAVLQVAQGGSASALNVDLMPSLLSFLLILAVRVGLDQ